MYIVTLSKDIVLIEKSEAVCKKAGAVGLSVGQP
jgi:hypothetical protein